MEENRRILIVDDETEALKGYEEFLRPESPTPTRKSSRVANPEQSGVPLYQGEVYELFSASTGEEAVAIFKKQLMLGKPIAAGFFDVKLGAGIDGLQTIQQIKDLDHRIHCVVVTAYHDRSVEEIHKIFGEDFRDQWDYLNKPFTRGEIIQKARQMIAAWNRLRKMEFMHNQLVQSERLAAVGQVARGVGHEFGNILMRVMGKIDLAAIKTTDPEVKNHLTIALQAVERAGVIVRNLQSFSKQKREKEKHALSVPLDEALSLIHHDLNKASIAVTKNIQPTNPVLMDKIGLGQVFLNLLINAIHAFGEKPGTLTLHVGPFAFEGKQGVACSVTDTGCGIPPAILDKIFDYAFTTKGDKGSGLGLAISKEIIEAHGGKLSVQSTVGKGTTFTLWIPYETPK